MWSVLQFLQRQEYARLEQPCDASNIRHFELTRHRNPTSTLHEESEEPANGMTMKNMTLDETKNEIQKWGDESGNQICMMPERKGYLHSIYFYIKVSSKHYWKK